MPLSTVILIAGAIALPLLLLAPFLWIGAPEREFRRKRARTLLAAAALFPLLALAHIQARRMEAPPPEPGYVTTLPAEPGAPQPPMPPPLPPPSPVSRQEDCPPGTTLTAGLCRAEMPIEE